MRSQPKKLFLVLLMLPALALSPGCEKKAAPPPPAQEEKAAQPTGEEPNEAPKKDEALYQGEIKIGHVVGVCMSCMFFAHIQKYFPEEGIQSKPVWTPHPSDAITMLDNDKLQVVHGPFTAAVQGAAKGAKIKIIAGSGNHGLWVLAQPHLKIKSIEDLNKYKGKGLKVGQKKPDRFPTANEVFQMKWLSIAIGEAHGFNEYHTRLFAKKPEYISQYLVEWQNNLCDVIGVGVSSWTNLRGVFSFNVGDISLQEYYGLIDAGKIPIDRGKIRTLDDEARRSFVVPIKNNRVNKARFAERTGITVHDYFGPQIERLKGLGLMDEDDTEIWLTKRGKFFVDEVCQQFFHPDYLPFPEVAGVQVGPSAGTISPC